MMEPINKLSTGGSNPNVVTIKEEEDEEEEEVMVVPKPLQSLQENGPPPFLNKTFEMVEDPRTDPIVSWSTTFDSFIVWDPYKLSIDLLPKYFKHSNFSSFVRQLNTYVSNFPLLQFDFATGFCFSNLLVILLLMGGYTLHI